MISVNKLAILIPIFIPILLNCYKNRKTIRTANSNQSKI